MTVPAQRVRRLSAAVIRTLPLLLVAALLVPVTLIFLQSHSLIGNSRALAERERLGVEYLRVLGPVTDALVDAQSAAVAGEPVSRDALSQAVQAAASVDSRIGGELRTHERWAGIRAKVEALPDRGLAEPEDAFDAYSEVTDLLLALHRKVGESSGLVSDPEPDSYFLQKGATEELPDAVVAAGRLADLTALSETRPTSERLRTVAELAATRVATLTPAGDLVDDLRVAVDRTQSTRFGANVLAPFDAYQRSIEALAAASAPGGHPGTSDPVQVSAARLDAQAAARRLQPIILTELDTLLRQRIDDVIDDQASGHVIAGAVIVILLLLVATVVPATRGTRPGDPDDRPADANPPPVERRELQPAGQGRTGDGWGSSDAAR